MYARQRSVLKMPLNTEGKKLASQLIETLKALIKETVNHGSGPKKSSVDNNERANVGEELLDTLQEIFVVKAELQEQETGLKEKQEEKFCGEGNRESRLLDQGNDCRFDKDEKESSLVKKSLSSRDSLKKQLEKPADKGFDGLKTIEVSIDVDSKGKHYLDVNQKDESLVNELVVMEIAGNKRRGVGEVEESVVAFEGYPNVDLIDMAQRPKTLDLKIDHCKVNGDCFEGDEGKSEMMWDTYGSLMNSGDSGVFECFQDIVDSLPVETEGSVKYSTSSCGKGSLFDSKDYFGSDVVFGEVNKVRESSKEGGIDSVQCQISVSPPWRSIPILKEPLTCKAASKIPRFSHSLQKTGKDDTSSRVMDKMKTLRDSILHFREHDFNGFGKSNLNVPDRAKKLNRPLSKSSSQLYERSHIYNPNFDDAKKTSSLQVPDRAKNLNRPRSSSSSQLYDRSHSYDPNINDSKKDAETAKPKKLKPASSMTNLCRNEVGLDDSLSFWRQRDSMEKLYSRYTADEKRVLRDIKCDIEFESYFKASEPVASRSWKALSTDRSQSTRSIDKICDDVPAETKEKKMDSSITQKRKTRSEINLTTKKKSISRDSSCDRCVRKRLPSSSSKIPVLVGR